MVRGQKVMQNTFDKMGRRLPDALGDLEVKLNIYGCTSQPNLTHLGPLYKTDTASQLRIDPNMSIYSAFLKQNFTSGLKLNIKLKRLCAPIQVTIGHSSNLNGGVACSCFQDFISRVIYSD